MSKLSCDKRDKAFQISALIIWAGIVLYALLHRDEITLETVLNYTPDKPFLASLVMLGLFALKSISLVIYSGLLYAASGIVFPLPLAILVNILGTIVMVAVHYVPAHRIGAARAGELYEKYPRLKSIKEFRGENDLAFAVLLRAVKVVNFDVGSMYMGAAGFHILPCLIGSVLGMFSEIVLFPIMGMSLGDKRTFLFWTTLVVDLLIALVMLLWAKKAKPQ